MSQSFQGWARVRADEYQAVLAQALKLDLAGEKQLIDLALLLVVEPGQEITDQQGGRVCVHLREAVNQLGAGFGARECDPLLQNHFIALPDAPGQCVGDIVEGQAIAADQQPDAGGERQLDGQIEGSLLGYEIYLSVLAFASSIHAPIIHKTYVLSIPRRMI